LYRPESKDGEANYWGLTQTEVEAAATVEVWPENVAAVNVFIAMGTQWNVGPGGAVGLNYPSLETTMRLLGVPKRERADVFEQVRVMEDAALAQIRSNHGSR
jgi:hypothetical protein